MIPLFYIASLKHTSRESVHILWWGPDNCGYTPVIARAGIYTGAQIDAHPGYYHSGDSTLAIPIEAATKLCVPQPFVEERHGGRYYDTPGPVVDNSRENWGKLLGVSALAGHPKDKSRPMWKGRPLLARERTRICWTCYGGFRGNLKTCPHCGSEYQPRR